MNYPIALKMADKFDDELEAATKYFTQEWSSKQFQDFWLD